MEFLLVFLDYTLAWSCLVLTIMRFVIPVVFYEITSVECVYSSDNYIYCYVLLYIVYFILFSVIT